MAKKIHFIGIGGVGMAGLARLIKARGDDVSGCDLKPSARTRALEAAGIRVDVGHDPKHVREADEVIITPAVPRDNAELCEFLSIIARESGVCPQPDGVCPHPGGVCPQPWDGVCPPPGKSSRRLRYRGEVLAELVSAADSVAVCGSHGKTTTSSWIARLLIALGEDPSWCIGGETGDFPVAGCGKGPLVVEADESDGTLALYRAALLVVNRCEWDHPAHFPTRESYLACFEAARRLAGEVIESESLPELPELSALPAFAALPPHNRRNARAAVEVALRRGHALARILAALPDVVARLPNRRFETLTSAGPHVVTDYAHHPTELGCAIAMARAATRSRVIVLFQPLRYSRTRALLDEFPAAFAQADEVVLLPTYAAFEQPIEGGDVADLYAALRRAGETMPPVLLAQTCSEGWEHARNVARKDDLVLLLGAGDLIRLAAVVRADLEGAPVPRTRRRVVIGSGTNTWRSELKLDVDYVRARGPAGRPGAEILSERGLAAFAPWMAGIPGTLGGWLRMNAGAFGHAIGELVEAVRVDGRWIPAADCGFGYRTSRLEGEIEDARFLPVAKLAKPELTAAECRARRRAFPPGTYGSFFKNPPGDFAGRLLEEAGAKGMAVGGAYVWSEHANVIVRAANATASDVLALSRLMRLAVRRRFGITLEPEVAGIGPL